ncbi:MAG: hypothetical protein EXX96DRAFT_560460 [Benjaminiella poitrasii]|nr:MAG: hypothetical protein EXX96DRAFT_560460 [Benjaminiella poitrasii]
MYRPTMGYRPQQQQQQPQYVVDDELSRTPSIRKSLSAISLNINPNRLSVSSIDTLLYPQATQSVLSLKPVSGNTPVPRPTMNYSKYGSNVMMTKTFHTIEPVPPFRQEHAVEYRSHLQAPSIPRTIPFKITDPYDKKELDQFRSIADILLHRASHSKGLPAFSQIDERGKEIACLTWSELAGKAEKVATAMRGLPVGDRVVLIYRKSEILDFTIALLGCFLAGVVAIPINTIEDLSELWFILRTVSLVLTTDTNLKNLTRNVRTRSMELPQNVKWWTTQDVSSVCQQQQRPTPSRFTALAYIEYTKSMTGELKGVVVSHQSIMSACHSFTAAVTETKVLEDHGRVRSNWDSQGADTVLTYLEPRQQVGLNLSVLCSVYNASHTIFANPTIVETPAAWIYAVSKYKVTVALTSYPGMVYAAKSYQRNPRDFINYNKKVVPDLSSLRFLFIDTVTVKPELNEYISNRLIEPLSDTATPLEVVTPILSLPEHAGAIVSFRDHLGPSKIEHIDRFYDEKDNLTTTKKRTAFANGRSRDVWECVLDADALQRKQVVVLTSNDSGVRVGSHGFPFPMSSVAIVDPLTSLLCPPDRIGEIWIDSPSLKDGFWGVSTVLSDAIYRASPILAASETYYGEGYDREYLRTGILGAVIGGRLVALGPYEDRVRQQSTSDTEEEKVHMKADIIDTVMKKTRVDSCTVFDIFVGGCYLPVLVFETTLTSRKEIAKIADSVNDAVEQHHGLRLYTLMAVDKGQLPRYLKDGNQYIHHLMTKRYFIAGRLVIKYLTMDVNRALFITCSDPNLSVWQTCLSSYERAIVLQLITLPPPHRRLQHTGIERVTAVIDERSGYDLAKFTNMIDIILWRTSNFPDEHVFSVVSQGELKPVTWRKLNNQIASLAHHFVQKCKLQTGTHVMILMHFGFDLVRTLYACFVTGLIPIICRPPETLQSSSRWILDDVNHMVCALQDLNIQHIITNVQTDDVWRHKQVVAALKELSSRKLQTIYIDRVARYSKMLGPESGFSVKSEWTADKTRPAFVLVHHDRQYVPYTHAVILSHCRSQKVTCQINFQRPLIVTGLNAFEGLGLLHAVFCGIYTGCKTFLMPTVEFRNNTAFYFELVSKYRCQTICTNYVLFEYAMTQIAPSEQRKIGLQAIQNVMITVPSRAKPRSYEKITRYLSLSRVEPETINTVYGHPFNPMITTRSYMLVEPVSLWIDLEWLRQGVVRPLPPQPSTESSLLLLHDSGIVPINTMVAIVHPVTLELCPSHVVGEIWVSSDCNIKDLYPSLGPEGQQPLYATIRGAGSDPDIRYMRTGYIGFLWHVQRGAIGIQTPVEEGQCLFVLGQLSGIIHWHGLFYFATDIEQTVERCHSDLLYEGCYVIQLEDKEIVVIATIKPDCMTTVSIVPIIVNSVLESHSVVVDTVVLVHKEQLPKKYDGEKPRERVKALFIKNEFAHCARWTCFKK